jgi:hypothetical protein
MRMNIVREADEEDCVGNPPDVRAGLGANEAVTQERDRSCRQLRPNWSDGRRQAGLFHEM